jgi:ADP-ribosylglycohydrolase
MKTILILEDNDERIAGFQNAASLLGGEYELRVWRDAPSMCEECEAFFPQTALICLDHDLNPTPGATRDPGTGLDVAKFLGHFLPVCPVLIHSSNTNRVYSMQNELRFAGWIVDRVGPLGANWIETSWKTQAVKMLAEHSNTWLAKLPSNHAERVERMMLSLDGLSIGDALGEMFAYRPMAALAKLPSGELPAGPWFHTDDTEMAISIVAVLRSHGCLNQDALAKRFARRWENDQERGYGKMTRIQMREIMLGKAWREAASTAFGGQGSKGNGGAMRVPPLGAYFAEEPDLAAAEAKASALVTHTHGEGVAGTIAAAVAASSAWQLKEASPPHRASALFEEVLKLTPESEVRRKILLASHMPPDTDLASAAGILGKGELVTAPDTVPFCIWIAAHHMDNYVSALAQAICVGGDCDTNAAIVGGIVALSAGRASIPSDWLHEREPIRF